jgi:hypothetical protein
MTEIKTIEAPTHWEVADDYSSHRPALWLALDNTGRTPVTEFGCGYGSTPLLQKYCQRWNRFFFSYETNFEWASKFEGVTHLTDYNKVYLDRQEWKQGVIFIDSAPGEERKDLIAKHAWNSEVIVVHDTESGAEYVYGMKEVLDSFKSRLDYRPIGMPHTTIVSNYVDLSKWKIPD